jgi:hypothetical protein
MKYHSPQVVISLKPQDQVIMVFNQGRLIIDLLIEFPLNIGDRQGYVFGRGNNTVYI